MSGKSLGFRVRLSFTRATTKEVALAGCLRAG